MKLVARKRRLIKSWFLPLVLALGALSTVSCAPAENSDIFQGCLSGNIEADQLGSFEWRARPFPMTILLDQQFKESQRDAILQSIRIWNAEGQELLGHDFFTVPNETETVPANALPSTTSSCGDLPMNPGSFYIARISDNALWESFGLHATHLLPDQGPDKGVTLRCWSSDRPIRQIMMMNSLTYVEKETSSVALHELGHVLGLGHSCTDQKGIENFKNCSELDQSHPYFKAVMYPYLDSNELKEVLSPNDKKRIECLYGRKG